jgi:uncharacterized DUF497 family protein
MIFDWDPFKTKSNLWKHGVSFEELALPCWTLFLKPLSTRTIPLKSSAFITFGVSARQRLLVVAYTDSGQTIRLISARLATRNERELYDEY